VRFGERTAAEFRVGFLGDVQTTVEVLILGGGHNTRKTDYMIQKGNKFRNTQIFEYFLLFQQRICDI